MTKVDHLFCLGNPYPKGELRARADSADIPPINVQIGSRASWGPLSPYLLFCDLASILNPPIDYTANMAIHPRLRPQASQGSLSPQQTMAISAWTEQATVSLSDMTLGDSTSRREAPASPSPAGLRGATVSLSIPLDDETPARAPPRVKVATSVSEETRPPTVSFRRREPLRRDSLKRREALLKGKGGSRRRQRWENGRCTSRGHDQRARIGR